MAGLTPGDIRRQLAGFNPKSQNTIIATVQDIDESEWTCTLLDDELEIPGVRLKTIVGENKGIVKIPKVGTYVLAILDEDTNEWVVMMAEEYDRILVIVGSSTIEMTDGSILVNGGNLGGMVKIAELTNKLNALVNSYNNHTHQVNTAGSATAQTGTAMAIIAKAAAFSKSDYEDLKFKH